LNPTKQTQKADELDASNRFDRVKKKTNRVPNSPSEPFRYLPAEDHCRRRTSRRSVVEPIDVSKEKGKRKKHEKKRTGIDQGSKFVA